MTTLIRTAVLCVCLGAMGQAAAQIAANRYVDAQGVEVIVNRDAARTPDKAEIAAAADRLRPIPGDCGDEYRRRPYLTASGDLSHHIEAMPTPYEAERGADGRSRVSSGTVWEDLAGFSRAVRKGNRISVSGTTATHGDRVIGGSDPVSQTHFVIDKIDGALQSLGASLYDVIRTRVYIRDIAHWEPVANVHGERFRDTKPANTLVQAGIIGSEYLVEIEAEAIVSG